MKVRDLMSRDVEFIAPDASVQDAATLMGEIDVGALPVGTAQHPRGVVTGRDLLYRVCAAGRDPAQTRVSEIMTHAVLGCVDSDDIEAALDRMAASHVRRLLVRDADGKTVGWVTLSDIARYLLVDSELVRRGLLELNRSPA